MNVTSFKRSKIFAVLAVLLSLTVLLVPFSFDSDTDAAVGEPYTYTISTNGTISGGYEPIGSSSTGKYTSVNGTNSGSWAFDDEGYGPFNSFYAAFDPAQKNRMIGHLDPDDLTRLVDGTSIAGKNYNILWCLPTVYWLTDSSGNLILTNDPDAGGTAYAHTIEGHTYSYIGIGVYEGSRQSVGGRSILTSTTDSEPTTYTTRATFRDYANNQQVNTDGDGTNGHAMLWNFYQWQLYRYCALAVMGGWDSQGIAGNGHIYGSSNPHQTGDLDKSGPYAGTRGDITDLSYNQDSVKVFIENAWGGSWDFVDGIIFSDRSYYIDTSAAPTDATSGTWITSPSTKLPTSYYGAYGLKPSSVAQIWGMPTSVSTAQTGTYDYIWASPGTFSLYVGGGHSRSTSDLPHFGLSCINAANMVSASSLGIGARLAFVFDSDPMSTNTVTFISNGVTIDTQSIPSGLTAIAPSVELYGYVLQGWFTADGEEFSPSLIITKDMIFIARWEGILQYTTDPISDGIVTAIGGQPGTVSFRATDSLYYSSILWDLGDGTTSTDLYATHYYSEPGTYTASLTVYNNHGSDVTTYQIEVPSADPVDDGTEWALVAAVVLIAFVSGALIARRLL